MLGVDPLIMSLSAPNVMRNSNGSRSFRLCISKAGPIRLAGLVLLSSLVLGPPMDLFAPEKDVGEAQTKEKKKSDSKEKIEELDDYVLTGTRIRRINLEEVVPVISLSREEIERSGATQVSELIGQLPVSAGVAESDQIGSFAGDGAQANLRGTGVGGTLILLNGRRMVPYAFSTARGDNFVDLNSIPIGAIERIEILKDGGSAIYGSDALAGIINFVLREDYEGGDLHAFYETTTNGKSLNSFGTNLSWGKTTARSSIMVTVNTYKRDPLMRRDRTFSENPDHSEEGGFNLSGWDTYPGFFEFVGLRRSPANFQVLEDHLYLFRGDGSEEDREAFERFNYNTDTTLVSGAERYGVFLMGSHEISNSIEGFAEFSYQDNTSRAQFAPAPLDRDFVIPGSNPFNPTPLFDNFFTGPLVPPEGIDITEALLRPTDPGPRKVEIQSRSIRAVGGLKGRWGATAEWEFAFLFGKSEVEQRTENLIRVDLFQEALNATGEGALNPFASGPGEDRNAAIYESITTDDLRQGERDFYQINAGISNELFTLESGPLVGHFGFEFRGESMIQVQSELAEQFLLFGSGGTSAEGERDVYALYGELVVPMTGYLEGHAAVRWEKYSDFGDTANPKLGLKFRPYSSLLVRASYSEGFQAPSLEQAFGGVTRGFVQQRDFLRQNFTFGVLGEEEPWPFDDFRSREVRASGNPELEPEDSRHFNIGLVYNPKSLKELTLSFDAWRLEIDNAIATRSIVGILADEEELYFEDPAAFLFGQALDGRGAETGVYRDQNQPWVRPETPTVTFTIPGKINYIESSYENFESVSLQGLDFEVYYHHRTQTVGDFWFRHYSVFVDRYVSGGVDLVGFIGIPKYQTYSSLQWAGSGRDLSAHLIWRYTSGYRTEFTGIPRVPSHSVIDLQFTYSGWFGLDLVVGVKNLLDRDPPANLTEPEGFDTNFGAYDPYGRRVSFKVRKSF